MTLIFTAKVPKCCFVENASGNWQNVAESIHLQKTKELVS
jgi:hypothetical protein